MAKDFKGKVVIITGASSGIGEALARSFSKTGAKIVLAARSLEKLNALQKELHNENPNIIVVKTDVSEEDDCQNLINRALSEFNHIDILINNAGISMRALFEDLDLSILKKLMDVNFWGMVYCTKYALPHLLKSKGSVVGISSIAGYRGLPARSGYSASKFAMQGFLESLRTENLYKGLHVLTVCPGFTSSNIRNQALTADGSSQKETPLDEKKIMSAEEVSQRVLKAILKRKKIIILTTLGKLTVFLNKWFPGYMDKLSFNHMAKENDSPLKHS
ncbi:MAG: SDR family oxidoreductase [Chitinophagaceae bacterium]|nr:MAG: SDR family oxidoreductase [Chitinophagaceae bacterium]